MRLSDDTLVKMFLRDFVDMLRRYGNSSDLYKADTIEDLLTRL